MKPLRIYTDGSCSNQKGGWAWVTDKTQNFGAEKSTTNNRMEMMAVLEAIKSNPKKELIIYSDSQYVVNSINKWIQGWSKYGWTTSKGDPVKNKDLWKEILVHKIKMGPKLKVIWKPRNSNIFLTKADNLAKLAYKLEYEKEK